jgi:hypothetical protein
MAMSSFADRRGVTVFARRCGRLAGLVDHAWIGSAPVGERKPAARLQPLHARLAFVAAGVEEATRRMPSIDKGLSFEMQTAYHESVAFDWGFYEHYD